MIIFIELTLIIQADFKTSLQPDTVVCDTHNYSFINPAIRVDGIYPITDPESSYTHFIKFTLPRGVNTVQERLTFHSPSLPDWVSQFNDDSGIDIRKNLNKTTGIKCLIQGAYDAFKNETIITTFNFNLKHK